MKRLTPAQQRLVTQNLGLAHAAALQFARKFHKVDIDELVADALMGLCCAAVGFNPSLGWKFSTYATKSIHTHMMRGADERTNFSRLNRVERRTGQRPIFKSLSITSDDNVNLRDIIPDRREPPADVDDLPILLARIPKRDREILMRRVGDGVKLREVGAEFKLTKERVRQIVEKACARANSQNPLVTI